MSLIMLVFNICYLKYMYLLGRKIAQIMFPWTRQINHPIDIYRINMFIESALYLNQDF